MIAFGLGALLWTTRLELFGPSDEPTIFDRAHRKVYRLFRERQPGLIGLFKPWPLRVCEYEWDLIDVEHTATVATTGSTVTRYHAIVFIIRRSADDPTIIDSFNIGNGMELGEQTVPAVWEHIRRFMEEGGPHLPPGERLAPAEPPHTLWQSLGAVGPFGPLYIAWWKERTAMQILAHVLLPLSVPFFLLWGIFNWLSYKTAYAVDWPDEIKRAVGPPLSAEDLARVPADVPAAGASNAAARPRKAAAPAKPPARAEQSEPISFERIEHPGGALELMLEQYPKAGANYVVVDAEHQVHRGDLDPTGRATLLGIPAGWLSIAYFAGKHATPHT